MKKSELNPGPDLAIPTLPVICDRCRAEGMAGDEAFAAIPDILEFEPVQRRAHANGWSPEHQRAFVAALAITGSTRQAARAIGRHAFGAETLRKAKGGRSFDLACEAAMDIARDRELERIHANLKELAASSPSPFEGEGRLRSSQGEGGSTYDDYDDGPRRSDIKEATARLEKAMEAVHRQYLRKIAPDPEKRHAYELLNGPVDWDDLGGWKLSEHCRAIEQQDEE